MPPTPEQTHELNKIYAEHHFDEAKDGNKYVVDFALLGLRSLFILNGGAIVGLFTFIGNIKNQAGSLVKINMHLLFIGFGIFSFGLLLAIFSCLFAYFCQSAINSRDFMRAYNMYKKMVEHSDPQGDESGLIKAADSWQIAGIVSALGSAACFALGAGLALFGLS